MKKRLLSVLMALCLVLSLAPTMAWALDEYDLWVGGVRVTSDNASSITGTGISGAVSYDVSTNTLTLNNATIYSESTYNEAIRTRGSSLNIQLIGNNVVAGKTVNSNSNYGMYIRGALTFNGNGSLTASAESCTVSNSTSAAILAQGDITVNHGCTITASCGDSGNIKGAIFPYGGGYKLILNGVIVTAANKDWEGDNTDEYNERFPSSYKYLKIEPESTPPAATTYTVSFDANGGTGEMTAVTVVKDATYSLPACTFIAPEGKEFDCWIVTIDNSSFSNIQQAVGDTINGVSADITLKAQWKATNENQGVVNAQAPNITTGLIAAEYTKGAAAVPLTIVAESSDGGTLSYQWSKGNGITGTNIDGATSSTYTPPTDTVGTVEYTCEVTNTITDNGDGGVKTAKAYSSARITVTEGSTSTPAEYTITFDGNGATAGSMAPQTFTENVAQALTQNVFTRDGYTFAGWNTAADGSGTPYTDKQSVTMGESVTLYAQWTENSAPADPAPAPSTGGNNSKPKYTAKVDKDVENGDISFSQTRVKAGRTVTITVTPDAGYELDKLVILDKNGDAVDFKDNGDGTFTFKMPKGGVEVEPVFAEIVSAEPEKETEKESEQEKSVLVLAIDQKDYLLDEKELTNDVAPIINGDRTVLPIRLVAETMGAKVTWSEHDQSVTITKDDTTMVIYIGQAFALVNGDPVRLDAPAFIANDRTYLPLRFVAENLGAAVTWDEASRTVTIVG